MGSSHDFKETPLNENMSQIFERMNLLHVDIMKLAVMPQNTEDVVRMLQFAEEANRKYKQPLVTMSMGQLGLVSRMMGNITGSAITFASVGKASAPGQMPAKKMKEILELLNHKKHLFFIGFMGCGKSTITEYLAKKLSLQHIDTDHKIEAEQNTTIENIFKENGEDYFRTLENQLLRQLETIQPSVIACGGGMAIKQENVAIMKRCGIVIMLKASPETIFERVRYSKKRPLLNGNMNTLYIKNLMSDRVSIYEQAADFIIDTDQRKPDEIVDDIINTLKKRN